MIAAATAVLLSSGVAGAQGSPVREVVIYRDAYGVPHIEGATSAAVMYGLGYSQGQDRLAHIELNRRTKNGTRAEILGPGLVEADKQARDELLSEAELMRMFAALPAEHQGMMRAYVDGLNRAIAEALAEPATKTPYEFGKWGIKPTPWTLTDFLSYIAAPHGNTYELQNLAFLNAMSERHGPTVGRRIFDDVVPLSDPDSPLIIPPGEDRAPAQAVPVAAPPLMTAGLAALREAPQRAEPVVGASRCLVIGPQKSASGRPLLMEATSDGPESHLVGGGFNTAGFSHAGWGPPILGRSARHGWLMTSGHAETTDTYAEKLDPADRHRYWFKGQWRRMEVRTETIRVKGAAPVTHEVAWTVHGPVIKWDPANGVAYAQRNSERGHELESWVGAVEMARARNMAEFEKAVGRLAWNLGVCYADDAGNIAYWEAGRLPKRPASADGRLPTPGTGEYEWEGFLSPREYPRMVNPKQGYIHTWNGKATSWMREGDDARIGKTYRTWLGNRLAADGRNLTLLDMREINRKIWNAEGARDRGQTSPDFFAAYVRPAAAGSADPEVRQAAELMLAFNGMYEDLDADGTYDHPGGTLWRQWLLTAPEVVFGPEIGDWWRKVDEGRYHQYRTSLLLRALQGKEAGLPLQHDYLKGRDREAVVAQTIRATLDKLRPKYPGKPLTEWRAPVFWKYYDAARLDPAKPALPGETLYRRTSAQLGYGPPAVRHHGGEGWAGMMELGAKDPALYSVVEAGGQNQFIDSAGKGNPNLVDQLPLHAANEFKRIDMSIETVRRNAVSVTRLRY
jgi:acyl-homoserine lactone acylase PvdQ